MGLWFTPSESHLRFFKSRFHCFDAAVIVIGFVIDVVLHGVLEEVASLVVILRLWRIFKIIEELSAGAEDHIAILDERIGDLEKANEALKAELGRCRCGLEAT
ncbi:MAG: hypothetical protein M1825_000813 [Sarcosagium campestre]|nr:MAG: hypothetical protein M1825_000813 [Sarcosagium campestre]